jgi:ribonuclease E
MSRQRLRTGVLEGSTSQCPHCQGTGIIRSTESVVLAVLRGIEDHLMKGPPSSISVLTTASVALYILNHKRAFIAEIEQRHGIFVNIQASERMQGANFAIERTSEPVAPAPRRAERSVVSMDWGFDGSEAAPEEEVDDAPEMLDVSEPRESGAAREEEPGEGRTRSRRRRRGRGRRDERGGPREHAEAGGDRDMVPTGDPSDEPRRDPEQREPAFADNGSDEAADEGDARGPDDDRDRPQRSEEGDGSRSRRRRRGRRGGRSRNRDGVDGVVAGSPADPSAEQPDVDPSFTPHGEWVDVPMARRAVAEADTSERGWEIKGAVQTPETDPAPHHAEVATSDAVADVRDEPAAPAPERMIEPKFEPHVPEPVTSAPASVEKPTVDSGELTLATAPPQEPAPAPEPRSDDPPRKGWWQRRFGGN